MAVHLGWLGTYVQTSHDDHDDVVGQGEIDIVHDQELVVTEARASVDVGLPRGFGATLVLPVRMVSTSIRYLDGSGAEVELTNPGIHHRNETLTGLGDPMVLGSYRRAVAGWRLGVRAGATLPLGRTEDDPFALGDAGMAHEHIQMGTGTLNPVLAIDVERGFGKWRLGGFALTQQSFYANRRGYQTGDRYAAGIALHRRVGKRWSLRGGGELQAETAERWGGIVHTDDGNRGRLDVMLAAGASWAATKRLSLELGVKVPVITRVVGGQLEMPAVLELGATWSFGSRAAARPADAEGEEGKLTVIDYWATWCKPCAILEPVLADLARLHPEEIELRRIDASDWDDYPWAMPHVTILDRDGKTLFDDSSTADLDAFIAAIHAVVDPMLEEPHTHIHVTEAGFEPGDVTVPAGVPYKLVFDRRTDKTCATEVIFEIDGERIELALPLDTPVEIELTFPKPGTYRYHCAMDMVSGTITAQ